MLGALLIFALICLLSGLLFRILGDLAIITLGGVLIFDGFIMLGIIILYLMYHL